MRVLHTATALAGLVLTVVVQGRPSLLSEPVIHETARTPPGWSYIAPAEDSSTVHLSVALKQHGLDTMRRLLADSSNPDHENYGLHLSRSRMRLLRQPAKDVVSAVTSWLRAAGILDFRVDGAWVRFNTTVQRANKLLGCELGTYNQKEIIDMDDADSRTIRHSVVIRAEQYSLPRRLADIVDFVYPVTQFISPPRRRDVVEMRPRVFGRGRTQGDERTHGHESWEALLEHLVDSPNVPNVVSIAHAEARTEDLVPEAYARRVCDLFMQIAARGVTVLVDATGSGVQPADCASDIDHASRSQPHVPFPASCPYVTAVGSTRENVLPGRPTRSGSGGGFSTYFTRRAWQDAAVSGYRPPPPQPPSPSPPDTQSAQGMRRVPSGRGVPDLLFTAAAASGPRLKAQQPGRQQNEVGASASVHDLAAVVAQVNERRIKEGRPVLGFLNPLLYSERMKGAFLDVKERTSSGACKSDGALDPGGWEAGEGWDPATGLGVLDKRVFVEALLLADV